MVSIIATVTFLDDMGYKVQREISATAEDYQGCLEVVSEVVDILEDTQHLTLEGLKVRRA